MQQELYMLKLASDQGLSPTKDVAWNFLCAMDDEPKRFVRMDAEVS